MNGPSSEQAFIVARAQRDATVVIRGYVYQVNMTLLRWIGLPPGRHLELEAGEGIDLVRDAVDCNDRDRIFEAIKHRERDISLRSPEALAALASFHEHRCANRSLDLAFRYVTNAAIASEQPAITELGTPGIHIWERIRNNAVAGKQKKTLISSVRSFLLQCSCPSDLNLTTWSAFHDYVKSAAEPRGCAA